MIDQDFVKNLGRGEDGNEGKNGILLIYGECFTDSGDGEEVSLERVCV